MSEAKRVVKSTKMDADLWQRAKAKAAENKEYLFDLIERALKKELGENKNANI